MKAVQARARTPWYGEVTVAFTDNRPKTGGVKLDVDVSLLKEWLGSYYVYISDELVGEDVIVRLLKDEDGFNADNPAPLGMFQVYEGRKYTLHKIQSSGWVGRQSRSYTRTLGRRQARFIRGVKEAVIIFSTK